MNPRMQYSQDGLHLTENFEGYSETSYQDIRGIWTCGYGHTRGVGPSTTCNPNSATVWLLQDIDSVVEAVNAYLNVPLTQGEFDALVDFGFNLGVHALTGSTLFADLQRGDFAGAAAQFSRWDHCGGKEIEGLLRRRLAEQAEFNQGDSNALPQRT